MEGGFPIYVPDFFNRKADVRSVCMKIVAVVRVVVRGVVLKLGL